METEENQRKQSRMAVRNRRLRILKGLASHTTEGKGSIMRKQDSDFFKKILTNWLEELERRADDTVLNLRNSDEILTDMIDQASYHTDQSFTLRIRNRERHLVNKIRIAIENIDDGTFGICEMCGEDIAIERLKARPVTTYCIDCKTRMEYQERRVAV